MYYAYVQLYLKEMVFSLIFKTYKNIVCSSPILCILHSNRSKNLPQNGPKLQFVQIITSHCGAVCTTLGII